MASVQTGGFAQIGGMECAMEGFVPGKHEVIEI